MLDYRLEHLFTFVAQLQPPQVLGAMATGVRVNFAIAGGEVSGPRLKGRLLAVGADFFNLQTDGVGTLDVRAAIETHDGALIDVRYQGVGDLGEDGHARFLRGELPPTLALRTAPRMATSHPDYLWANRLQCIGIGEADFSTLKVRYDVYSVR